MSTNSPEKFSTPIKLPATPDPKTPKSPNYGFPTPTEENLRQTEYSSPSPVHQHPIEDPVPSSIVLDEYNRFINSLRSQTKPSYRENLKNSDTKELKPPDASDQKDYIISVRSYENYGADNRDTIRQSLPGTIIFDNDPKSDNVKIPMLRGSIKHTPEKKSPRKKSPEKRKSEKKMRLQNRVQNMGLSLKIKTKISLPEILALPARPATESNELKREPEKSCKELILSASIILAQILFHVFHIIILQAYLRIDHKIIQAARNSNIWGMDIVSVGFLSFLAFEFLIGLCSKGFQIKKESFLNLLNNLVSCLYPLIEAIAILALWVYPLSKTQLGELNELMVFVILCFGADMIFFLVYFIKSVSKQEIKDSISITSVRDHLQQAC